MQADQSWHNSLTLKFPTLHLVWLLSVYISRSAMFNDQILKHFVYLNLTLHSNFSHIPD